VNLRFAAMVSGTAFGAVGMSCLVSPAVANGVDIGARGLAASIGAWLDPCDAVIQRQVAAWNLEDLLGVDRSSLINSSVGGNVAGEETNALMAELDAKITGESVRSTRLCGSGEPRSRTARESQSSLRAVFAPDRASPSGGGTGGQIAMTAWATVGTPNAPDNAGSLVESKPAAVGAGIRYEGEGVTWAGSH